MSPQKPIDEALLTAMWNRGASHHAIGAAVGISRPQVPRRAAKLGLPDRIKPAPKPRVRNKRSMVRLMVPKPAPDPKPIAAPVYRPGLSDAIKRAKASGDMLARLGKVATVYGLKYREVMEMAGVTE